MGNQRQNFFRAFSILNSLFIFVFILFLIDRLNLSFLLNFGFIYILLITGFLKIYCMSAIGGGILEIISAEELVLRLRRIHQNAACLVPGFLVVFVSIFLIEFLLFSLFPAYRGLKPVYSGLLSTIAAFVLAQWAIDKKYIHALGIPRRKISFNLNFLMVMLSAFLLEMILGKALNSIHTGNSYWLNISALVLNYIHVFEFIFSSLYVLDHYPEINEKFRFSKEIFLINPVGAGIVRSLAFLLTRGYPPFFIALKALSPKAYQFREFNQVLWYERYYKSNALVCITCYTSNCYEAYKIAKEFKKRGSKVVMGGPHVTYLPKEALAFCDSVVIGAAEGVWEKLMKDYEQGELKSQYQKEATEEDFNRVREELLNSPPSVAKDFLEITRGCKFQCHFCTIPALNGGQMHYQSIKSFVELIQKIKPYYSHVSFIDNNIYSDPAYAKKLFIALKPLKIKWHSECTIDIAKNAETLRLAKESGCAGLGFGYEISGGSLEKKQGGKLAMAQKYIEYTRIVKKAGIEIKGQFIYGFDSDSFKTLFQLWKFCFSIMPKFTSLSILTPLPGSGLYREMLLGDRIISLNWRSYNCYSLVVRHPHLNPSVVTFFYPLIQVIFLLTTSSIGLWALAMILFLPVYRMAHILLK